MNILININFEKTLVLKDKCYLPLARERCNIPLYLSFLKFTIPTLNNYTMHDLIASIYKKNIIYLRTDF
jgi:hypothetical protein